MLKQRVFIQFDGIFMNSDVYINGNHLGNRPYGYISFGYDISKYLVEGVNVIAVRVDCQNQEASRWYNGCGIYRHVWLTITEKIFVDNWGTYITTPQIEPNAAIIKIETDIINQRSEKEAVTIINTIYDRDNKEIHKNRQKQDVLKGANKVETTININTPKLWSIEDPYLYKCGTQIATDAMIMDTSSTTFGIRTLEWIPNKGFVLNGQNLKFKGVCNHHDSGVVGAAVLDKVLRNKLNLLKDMGCNAIRTAHNPFAPEFYDLCDELGLLVIDEIFDGWDEVKAKYDYGLYFDDWYEKDVTDFMKRDRNHPCIVMCSIGNEVPNMQTEITKKLSSLVHSLDPTRPVTCGVEGVSQMSEDNRAMLQIAGYNDGGGACFLYDRDHTKRPNQLMIATEAPHTRQTRGFYRTQTWWRDKNQARMEVNNLSDEELFFDGHIEYKSSYDNSGVRVCIRDSWTLAEERAFHMGEFRWTGFDYYGESYAWPARHMDSGIIGLDNCPKDSYYLYQSMWTKEPMIHMLPHWTHPNIKEGTAIPVWVYTNCEVAEVVVNGKCFGKKTRGNA